MIEDAMVRFSNGNSVEVERVKFKDGGWIGVGTGDEWVYYPPRAIVRVISSRRSQS